MLRILRSVSNPTPDRFNLSVRQFPTRLCRRHPLFWVLARNPPDHFALIGFTRHNRVCRNCRCGLVQTQLGLSMAPIGAVARKAVFGKDGANFEPKIWWCRLASLGEREN